MPLTHRFDGVVGGIVENTASFLQKILKPEGTVFRNDEMTLTREGTFRRKDGLVLPAYRMVHVRKGTMLLNRALFLPNDRSVTI